MIGTHTVNVYADRSAPVGTPVDVTCLVDELSIRHGRGDTTGQPEASTATLEVTVGPGTPMPDELDIGAWLVVTTTVGGTTYTRFVGRVTDLSIGWDDAGEATPDQGIGQVVATSSLADLARRVIGDTPFPQELDGARVSRVCALAGVTLAPATSDPGTVEVITRDVDARGALEIAHGTANSAGGLLWVTRAGEIRYADAEHRRNSAVALDLDVCDILVSPTWQRNLNGLVNEVSATYGYAPTVINDEGESESVGSRPTWSDSDEASKTRFGRYEYSTTLELAKQWDTQMLVALILGQNNSPVWMLEALPLDVASLDLATTQTLLGLELHALVRIGGLPDTGATPTSVAAFIEGWSERLAWGVHDLELVVSDYCRTAPPPRWDDQAPALTWDTVTPSSTTWNDVACSGMPAVNTGTWDTVSASLRWDMVAASVTWDSTAAGVP